MRPNYSVGTLFEEEEIDQKKNINNMKNKDPMGNTRWQGAFTGGFSAGFKNTCGSKQGWQPAQFISSVSRRAQKKQQNISDFMDKEDMGRQSIANNIQVSANFKTSKPNPFNIVVQNSVGQSILSRLNKKKTVESVLENPLDLDKLLKYYQHQEIMEESIQPVPFSMKEFQKPYSVGGSDINAENDQFIENYEELYRRVIRATVKQESDEERNKRIEQNKIYFDFSKPFQQQPQYLKEIHQIQDLEKPRKRKKNLLNLLQLKDIFTQSIEFKQFLIGSTIDKVPQDYDPYHKIRAIQGFMLPEKKNQLKDQKISKHRIHSIEQRIDILGYQKLSNKFRSATPTSLPAQSNQTHNSSAIKYFDNEKKNLRYVDFVEELEGRKIASQHEYLSYDEAQKQRLDFEQMYKKQKQIQKNRIKSEETPNQVTGACLSKQLENILTVKKYQSQKSTILRTVTAWRPSQLLCKRFECLLPYKIEQKNPGNQFSQEYF